MVASVISCLTFMVLGRRWYRMPIDFTALCVMPGLAALFVFGAHATVEIFPGSLVPLAVDGLIFALFGGFCIRYFGLLNVTPPATVGDSITVR